MLHIVPAAPPQAVTPGGGFDYVTVDARRGRVYAAHGDAGSLLIVNAKTGKVLGLVHVGGVAGVVVNPANGHVYTGNGDDQSISEVDPQTQKVLRTLKVDGKVDALAYDPANHIIYADEDDGTRVFAIDAKTFTLKSEIPVPGHKPEFPVVDPETHELYQNIANTHQIAVIDPTTMIVSRTIATPELVNNHPLQYDAENKHLIVGGANGIMSSYDRSGKKLSQITVPKGIDQCNFDAKTHRLGCAGHGTVTVVNVAADGTLENAATYNAGADVHTLAFDEATGNLWIVGTTPSGSFVQELTVAE